MKTTKQIFDYLIKNAKYYKAWKAEDIPQILKESKEDGGITLEVAIESIPSFHVEFDRFEKWLGEKYSFRKHLKPLIKKGLISCSGIPKKGDLYDSQQYRKIFDNTWGLVKDYKTNRSYVNFWLGRTSQ